MHRLLARQLKRTLGLDEAAWSALAARLAGGVDPTDPAIAGLLQQLPTLFGRVSDSYEQHERESALLHRSLELSSAELTESNARLREESETTGRALNALESAVETLLAGVDAAHAGPHNDLADLAEDVLALSQQWAGMQQALAQSEERFNLAMRGANDGLYDWDRVRNTVYLSDRYCMMLGYAPGELGSSVPDWTASIHPDDAASVLAAVEAYVSRASEAFNVTFRCRHKDGHYLWILSRGVCIWNEAGEAVRMVGTHTDVTAHIELEKYLSEFKEALDEHAIVSITNPAGVITYANDNFCKISGYAREALIGQNHRIVKSGIHTDAFYVELWQTISSGQTWRGEVCNRARDGSHYWVLATIAPILDSDGLPLHYIAIRTDITQNKNIQAELQLSKEAAESASRAKSEFLATMSHEIRTPMNGVLGTLALTLETPLDAEQREYLQLAQHSAESLLAIINDILDFSKIEAGRMDIQHEEFNLDELLQHLGKMFQARCQEKGLAFGLELPAALPQYARGDSVRIRQVLVNLLGNAIKFTERGSVRLVVAQTAPGRFSFAVHDTGIGIPQAKQDTVFEAFSQADGSITRKFGGTGLGLTISNRLAQLMGGQLSLSSTPGAGSVFTFELPLTKTVPVASPSVNATAATVLNGRGLRILVVEDNPVNQRLASVMLGKAGFVTAVADHGEAALNILKERQFDLILMDMQMPGMDGVETTEHIRQREHELGQPRTPIIAFTANAFEADKERCLAAGMDAFQSKPIRRDALLETVARLLGLDKV